MVRKLSLLEWRHVNGFASVHLQLHTILCIALRLISYGLATDLQEAMALSHQSEVIQIYSNSWGPPDYGGRVDGPGPLVQQVFEAGVQQVNMSYRH